MADDIAAFRPLGFRAIFSMNSSAKSPAIERHRHQLCRRFFDLPAAETAWTSCG
ncbi:UNVERIFIED_ORG: hypothetical protein GGI66_001341 [Rhizobium esperanzae]|uniref:hypothetical protein n=1 Tax=Rhizobium phaseoli TaxID=396 RepID=UPI0013DF6DEF|nr:hypothetical protein [Rhizobium phaseoli]